MLRGCNGAKDSNRQITERNGPRGRYRGFEKNVGHDGDAAWDEGLGVASGAEALSFAAVVSELKSSCGNLEAPAY